MKEACGLAPPGPTFTFHLHNGGSSSLWLNLGCGRSIPIVLDTSAGNLSIGPGVDVCEFTCDQIYQGGTPGACTDCGPGYWKEIEPGKTVDVPWERAVYMQHTLAPDCTAAPGTCALGVSVPAVIAQKGVLTVCGTATASDCTKTVPLVVDTSGKEATVEVM